MMVLGPPSADRGVGESAEAHWFFRYHRSSRRHRPGGSSSATNACSVTHLHSFTLTFSFSRFLSATPIPHLEKVIWVCQSVASNVAN